MMKIGKKSYKMRFSLMTLQILQEDFELSFSELSKIDDLGIIFKIAYSAVKCELIMADKEVDITYLDVAKAIDKEPSILKQVMEGASQMGQGLQALEEPAKN